MFLSTFLQGLVKPYFISFIIISSMLISCDEKKEEIQLRGDIPTTVLYLVTNDRTSIDISWDAITGVTHYKLFYSTDKTNYTQIGGVLTQTSYHHSDLQPDTEYHYKIVACIFALCSQDSIVKSIKTSSISIPTLYLVTNDRTSIDISWDAITGVTHYKLFYSTDTTNYTQIGGSLTTTAYQHGGLQPDTEYHYKIVACISTRCYKDSSILSVKTNLIMISLVDKSYNHINISWTDVTSATSYKVLYQEVDTSSIITLATTTDLSFNHNNLKSNTNYIYYIDACVDSECSKNRASLSVRTDQIPISNLSLTFQSPTSLKLNWSSNVDNVYHNIYYASDDINFTKIISDSTSNGSYIHNDRPSSNYYQIEVCFSTSDCRRMSSIVFIFTNITFSSTSSSITAQWNVATDVTSYSFNRYSFETDSTTTLLNNSTTATNYSDTNLKTFTPYIYTLEVCLQTCYQIVRTERTAEGSVIDPLYAQQWHLNNTSQTAYAGHADGGLAGEDVNVASPHANNIRGKDIIVAVADSGLVLEHDDYRTIKKWSYDYAANDNDPEPKSDGGDHGTSVGGLIGMIRNNGKGGQGVAPDVFLIGHNIIQNQAFENFAGSLGVASFFDATDRGAENAHIINQSYGLSPTSYSSRQQTFVNYYNQGVEIGRNNLGYIYVKAAGNGFNAVSSARCDDANLHKISCENSNFDPNNTLAANIVVSASNANGKLTSYSTTGSNIWVAAPGGQYGASDAIVEFKNPSNTVIAARAYYPAVGAPNRTQPAMITVDVPGCDRGYSRSSIVSPYIDSHFNYQWSTVNYSGVNYIPYRVNTDASGNITTQGWLDATTTGAHADNPNCDYTNTFNGTSSAAPVTSGVAALILSANVDLSWRDVKHIFAKSSDQIDATHSDITIDVSGDTLIIERGWITNHASNKFSNRYGFGRVNAANAVSMAQSYTMNSLGQYTSSDSAITPNTSIPNNSAAGKTESITLSNAPTSIESVEVYVEITHSDVAELFIELESPQGTKSILFTPFSSFSGSENLTIYLTSNAFYEENGNGTWKMKVADVTSDNTQDGTINQVSVKVFGH